MESKVDPAAAVRSLVSEAKAAPSVSPLFIDCRVASWIGGGGWTREVAGERDFLAAVRAYAECALSARKGMFVCGACGCGKTALVKALTRRATKEVAFIPLDTDWERLDPESWPHFVAGLMGCHVVLDDLGAEPPANDFGVRRELAGEFIARYHRFGRGRLFVTTNLDGAALVDRYTMRVARRLKDLCVPLRLTGPDKRTWDAKGGAA